MHASQVAVVEDKVHALGGTVPNDGLITWLPEGTGGHVPLNAYLLRRGRTGLLVDTQMPVVAEALMQQLAGFELDVVDLVLTRVIEFDSVGNAELVERALPLRHVYAHYVPEQWIYIRGAAPERGAQRFESRLLQKHQRLEIAPGFEVSVMEAPLKLLTAAWVYDHETRTMLTSDAFTHVLAGDPGRRVVTAGDDDTTQAEVQEHLRRKFDWLEGAETEPIRRFLAKTFDEYDIEHIAPTFGCVLSGRDVVARHYTMIDEALRSLGAKPAEALGATP